MRRKKHVLPPRVEMLPLLDVLFVLLAVFIYSMLAMVRAHVVPVDLPQLVTGETRDLPVVLTVSVDAGGQVSVGGDAVDYEQLEQRLRDRRSMEPGLAVVLNADSNARHGIVTEVFDRLRAAGQERVFIVGRKVEDAPAK